MTRTTVQNTAAETVQDAKAGARREEILLVARNRMMQYGIQKTTMSEIAQEVGMAVGTLYLSFKNKEEIVLALAQTCRREQTEAAEEIIRSALSPEEKLLRFLCDRFNFVRNFRQENPHGKEFVHLLMQLDPTCSQQWQERFEGNVSRILGEACKQGIFPASMNTATEARFLFLATQGFFPLPYLDLPRWPQEEELLLVVRRILEAWRTSS